MDGIILIDKPEGITSAGVVRRIKTKVKPARVGHLGTLDPFATGVLPILVGEATKLAPMLESGDKEYEGTIRLGLETDTLDRDGRIVREAPIPEIDGLALAEVGRRFTGVIEQTPPIFSAIKHRGARLYELARKGVEVEAPAPRVVEIKRLLLTTAGADLIRFSAVCSPGTYLRALARDIGLALGTVAHLHQLRRLRNGSFALAGTVGLEHALEGLARGELRPIGLREALAHMPEVAVDANAARRLRNGDARALDGLVPTGAREFKVINAERLIVVARAASPTTASILRVFTG